MYRESRRPTVWWKIEVSRLKGGQERHETGDMPHMEQRERMEPHTVM
jgi:hypothetical protein